MKRLEEMTDDELMDLTLGRIEELLEIECTARGINMPIDPGPEPGSDAVLPKAHTVYRVHGTLYADVETAKKAAALPTLQTDYKWEWGWDFQWLIEGDEEPEIKAVNYWTEEQVRQMAATGKLANLEEQKKVWKAKQELCIKQQKAVQKVYDDLMLTIRERRASILRQREEEQARLNMLTVCAVCQHPRADHRERYCAGDDGDCTCTLEDFREGVDNGDDLCESCGHTREEHTDEGCADAGCDCDYFQEA